MSARNALGFLTVAASLALSSYAHADAATAEALFRDGKALFDGGKFSEACDKFGESLKQDAQIGTLQAQALACEKGGRLASAWAAWNRLTFDAKAKGNSDLASGAQQKAAALEPNLSKLTITTADANVPGLLVRRDGQDIGSGGLNTGIPVDPGPHVIEATAPGYEVWQTTVTIGPLHDLKSVTIPALNKKTDASGNPEGGGSNKHTMRLASYIVGGTGVAVLGLGAVMGILAIGDKSDATSSPSLCGTNNKCTPAGKDKIDSASTKATVSTIGVIGGGALVGTGVVLFILSRGGSAPADAAPATPPPAARWIPTLGPQGGGLTYTGTF